jgi:RNA polymerase sigma-70 factor, ECF subfamily
VNSAPRHEPTSDWSLINRVVNRDETALAVLYDRYAGLVCATLNRILRDSAATEEVLQDIFLQIWRNAANFDPSRGSLPGFLIVAARNRAISRLRRSSPETREVIETDVVMFPNLESEIARKEMMVRVQAALNELPSEQKKTVELAYFEGLTHSEIAERTGDPLGTVKTRLRSAVEVLKKKLQS